MPIDDPVNALKYQYELEDSSTSPVVRMLLNCVSRLPLAWPFDKGVEALKSHLATDSLDRIGLMLETCLNEVGRHESEIQKLKERLPAEELQRRVDTATDLLADATRRAFNTRSRDRVKRIGLILANGVIENQTTNADEIEELMRVAMELSDNDIRYLGELVRIEGLNVRSDGRLNRYAAHAMWESGFWTAGVESEIDSVFSKLEGYGLVARIPPPNNLNITTDFQNRYVLLAKGLRFVDLIQQKASANE